MPLVDCGIIAQDGQPDRNALIWYGPGLVVTVCGYDLPKIEDPGNSCNVHALIDTGASQSCIDSELAKDLDLKPVDEILMAGVGGSKKHIMYLAHILIPQLDIVQWGSFAGVDLKAGGQLHGVLLGRTFLNDCILIYDGVRAQVTIASPKRT